MNGELQQNAVDVLEKSVKIASGGTVATGAATAFDFIAPFAGTLASVIGSVIAYCLYKKKSRLLDLQIKALEGKDNDVSEP